MTIDLELPLPEERVRALHVGDEVRLSGRLCTAREAAHQHLVRGLDPKALEMLQGRVVYHCGPVVVPAPGTRTWQVVAAGPSESSRVEPWTPEVVAR
jgi:tartrate dehydratase beta subunit/fumarate hydratase class I family protein